MKKYTILSSLCLVLVCIVINVDALKTYRDWDVVDPCAAENPDESGHASRWYFDDANDPKTKRDAARQLTKLREITKSSAPNMFQKIQKIVCSKHAPGAAVRRVMKMIISGQDGAMKTVRKCVVESYEQWWNNEFRLTYHKCQPLLL